MGTVLATTATHYLPRTYSASTAFERVDDDVLKSLPVRGSTDSFLWFRETLSRDVTSPAIMDAVVARLGLAADLPRDSNGHLTTAGQNTLRAIGDRLASGVSAGLLKSSAHKDTIQLTYTGPDREVGANLLDAIREVYIAWTRERITRKLQENKVYFEEEAAARRDIVERLEYEEVMTELENPTIDPTNPNTLFIRLTSLKNEERELARKQESVRNKLLKTRQYVGSIVATSSLPAADREVVTENAPVLLSPRAREIKAEIARIDSEIEELKITRRMTDRHPEIVERRELRQRYEERLSAESESFAATPTPGVDVAGATPAEPMGEIWHAEKLRAEMEIVAFEDELERIAGALRVVNSDIEALEQARDNVPAARAAHREHRERLAQARNDYEIYAKQARNYALLLDTDENERGIRFNPLGPAIAGSKPTSPKSKSVLVLALLIGTGAGVAMVLLAELFDRSYHTAKQVVQSLGLNVLETIDEIVTSPDRVRRFRRRFILAPAAMVLLLGSAGLSMSMAYLSIERPATYERLMEKPRSLWQRRATRAGPDLDDRSAAVASPAATVCPS